jgi:hypothetical protein
MIIHTISHLDLIDAVKHQILVKGFRGIKVVVFLCHHVQFFMTQAAVKGVLRYGKNDASTYVGNRHLQMQ